MRQVSFEEFLELKEENLKLRETILDLKQEISQIKNNFENPKKEMIEKETYDKKDSYKSLFEFRLKKNKKEILKQKILEIVKEKLDLSELKFLFVDFNKYSSKATFYSYLKELEFENRIKIEKTRNSSIVSNLEILSIQR